VKVHGHGGGVSAKARAIEVSHGREERRLGRRIVAAGERRSPGHGGPRGGVRARRPRGCAGACPAGSGGAAAAPRRAVAHRAAGKAGPARSGGHGRPGGTGGTTTRGSAPTRRPRRNGCAPTRGAGDPAASGRPGRRPRSAATGAPSHPRATRSGGGPAAPRNARCGRAGSSGRAHTPGCARGGRPTRAPGGPADARVRAACIRRLNPRRGGRPGADAAPRAHRRAAGRARLRIGR